MADFSLPPWLIPQPGWYGNALAKGVQAGSQIANNMLQARQLAASVAQAQIRAGLEQREQAIQQQRNTIQMAKFFYDQEVDNKVAAGEASLSRVLADPVFKWTDPAQVARIYEVGAKYPIITQKPFWGQLMTMPDKAADNERLRLQALASAKTSAMQNLEEAARLEREAAAIEGTDPARATAMKRDAVLLRGTTMAPTETIRTTTDEHGRQNVEIVRGPATEKAPKDLKTPTTTTQSQVQQRLLAGEKIAGLGADLLTKLTESDVGVRGNINQVVINEGLAQFFPNMQRGEVTDARTLLGMFNENVIKLIASDPRISDKDRANYERILPRMGPRESLPSTLQKIRTFMDEFRSNARTDINAIGAGVPDWALTVDELKNMVKSGEMSQEEAVQIMVKYH